MSSASPLLRAPYLLLFTLSSLSMVLSATRSGMSQTSALRFEVKLKRARTADPRKPEVWPRHARLLVVLGRPAVPEPRLTIGQTGKNSPPVLGCDVDNLAAGAPAVLDAHSAIFPLDSLSQLPRGTYAVQALLHTNLDLNLLNAPGDLHSPVTRVRLDPAQGGTVGLELSQAVPTETLPSDSELVRYLKIRSRHLSDFHGRPIYLRAGVILPRDFSQEPKRHYPVRVHIGGYGARFTEIGKLMEPGSAFHRIWTADDTPRAILVKLDGAGPLGDPYQIDSANHGPFGTAITRELIPYIEENFRGIGQGYARTVDGGSTGGWVALALQIFYPDFFNGAWAFCPDSVDFRSFQLVNIYEDRNAYVNQHGFERPAAREVSGEVLYTMRHECQLENVLGRNDSWTLSGGQWGAWNATYGARGPDGKPIPLWDSKTGKIDPEAAVHWKAYDLRRILEENWTELGPKLKGKLHIWIGESDDYFLNNAVHRLDALLSRARPHYEGTITYGPGEGHCWIGISEKAMMKQMAQRVAAAMPGGTARPARGR